MDLSETAFGGGRVGALSLQAVRYALHLARLGCSGRLLSQALYEFNRAPTASLARNLPTYTGSEALADQVERELAGEGVRIARYERRADGAAKWVYWDLKDAAVGASDRLRHKLYVSPRLAFLPSTLRTVLSLCEALSVPALKLGLDTYGVTRSDKIVVYFAEPKSRARFADALTARTIGVEAQGVPLSRPIGAGGLISSAEDPGLGSLSWRQLVSAELADIVLSRPVERGAPFASALREVGVELERRGLMPGLVGAAL